MYIKFENLIKRAIGSGEFKQRLLEMVGEEYGSAIMQHDFRQTIFAIETCPKNIEADISSNVCFVLAKILKQLVGIEIKPIKIAEIVQSTARSSLFELSLGGGGYINAGRTECFLKQFINQTLGNMSEPLLNIKEFDAMFPWRQLAGSESEDIRKLMRLYQTQESNELRFMLLALLGNVELDINSYLNNIYGSENLPWYIRRFISDTETIQNEIKERFSVKDEFCDNMPPPKWLLPSVSVICKYRYVVKNSLINRHPEVLPILLVETISAFYKFYNHPECRSLKTSVYNYSDLYIVVRVLRAIVQQLTTGMSLNNG